MFPRNGFEGLGGKRQIHRVTRLVGKVDSEPGKNSIDRLNFSETPAPVHAKTAGRQQHQSFDVLAFKLARRRHFLEFFSH